MKFKNIVTTTLFTCLISSLIFLVGFADENDEKPREVYQVYLAGQKIGLIKNDQELYDLIDKEQNLIKKEYRVNKIYPPEELEIKKYLTYKNEVKQVIDIYNIIKETSPFTIPGFTATIKKEDGKEEKIHYLNEKDMEIALNSFINAFIPKEKYDKYMNDNQEEIVDTGSILENIYFLENLSVKKDLLSTENDIYVDSDSITQHLLFGPNKKEEEYIVKTGDDVETISYNNKLNVEEFLIANPSIKSVNQLLSAGQKVNIALINPVLSLVYEEHLITDTEKFFETDVKYNASLSAGVNYVEQAGENGIDRVTSKQKIINGAIQEEIIISVQELKPAITKVVVRGSQKIDGDIDNTIWKWPSKYYSLSSGYEWRGNSFHKGLDIPGKNGSPIYAASGGIVWSVEYIPTSGGNVVKIDHQNGYFTVYAHLQKILVKKGQVVSRGYTIGLMGKTGVVTGTHLHFEVWHGAPSRTGSYHIDPRKLFN